MFTGLIESVGTIDKISTSTISVNSVLDGIDLGDSVSINGICLTVIKISDNNLTFDFSPETAEKTTINKWRKGTKVNLERALKVGDRLGGHFVTGHIDGTGVVEKISQDKNSIIYSIKTEQGLSDYLVNKGSVAIDGISLTIIDCKNSSFTVSVIPHTLKETTLQYRNTGDLVNIETDILSKQVVNLRRNRPNKLSEGFLKENGFI